MLPISQFSLKKIDYRTLIPLQSGSVRRLSGEGYERLRKSFTSIGYSIPLFVWESNERHYILDGHGREKVLLEEGLTFKDESGNETYEVPCLVIAAESEVKAREKILLINSRYQEWGSEVEGFMKGVDVEMLQNVVNIPEISIPDFFTNNNIEDIAEVVEELGAEDIKEYRNNVLFERGTNRYDIPSLLPHMIPSIPTPLSVFIPSVHQKNDEYTLFLQGQSRKGLNKERSVLSFYSWDSHFEGLWGRLLEWVERVKEYMVCVSPNYTIQHTDPIVFQAWQVYRSRYIGRYWQEAGVKVIPDIIWSDESSYDFCFLGIPLHPTSVSIQVQNFGDEELWGKGFNEMLKRVQPQSILAYCPKNRQVLLERYGDIKGIQVVFVEPYIGKRRKEIRSKG